MIDPKRPNGETQLTPMPTERRGFGELPRKTSLKPVCRVESSVGSVGPPGVLDPGVTIRSGRRVGRVGRRLNTIGDDVRSAVGVVSFHTEPTSTKTDGRRPRLRSAELVGNSSSSRPM